MGDTLLDAALPNRSSSLPLPFFGNTAPRSDRELCSLRFDIASLAYTVTHLGFELIKVTGDGGFYIPIVIQKLDFLFAKNQFLNHSR